MNRIKEIASVVFGTAIFFCTWYILQIKKSKAIAEKQVIEQESRLWKAEKDLSLIKKNITQNGVNGQKHSMISPGKAAILQRQCKNSIVKIIADQFTFNWLEPYKNTKQVEAKGSGFFIDNKGHFLTNFHVVSQAARIQIQMPSFGQEKLDCHVVGVCPDRDLALLKVSEETYDKIKSQLGEIEYLELGDSDQIGRGGEILTLGFPLGKDMIKSTTGIVSGWEDIRLGERGGALSCLEITAPINGGSSGGPALDLLGNVIGINFAGVTEAQNVGYVLPINELKTAIKQLDEQKLLFKPHLGFVSQVTNKSFAHLFNNPEGGGLYVRRVLRGSLAEKAGILTGDVIYEINGFKLDHHGDTDVPWREDKVFYTNILQRLEVGDEIEIILYRKGLEKTINFKLENSDSSVKVRSLYPCYEEIDYEVFGGFVVMELAINHVAELYSNNTGLLKYALPENIDKPVLVVTFVQGTSEAHRNSGGVGKGNIIAKIGGVPVNTLTELRAELQSNINKEFITISGDDLSLTILETDKLLKNEPRLAQIFKYSTHNSLCLWRALELNP